MNKKDIENILLKISMAPSCLDMGWEWRVNEIGEHGFTFALSFQRPDTNSGEIGRGWGRDWIVAPDATEKFIVMTAWLAIELILRHEAMEAFHFDNARILDPHKSLDEIAYPEKLGQKQEPSTELKKTKINITRELAEQLKA